MDQVARLGEEPLAPVNIQVPISQDRFVDGEHQKPPPQRAADGGEAGGGDLLEDRHQEAERLPLASLALRQVEAVLQVLLEAFVELPLAPAT